jgi:uncharacterized damage-inducible protein DinB
MKMKQFIKDSIDYNYTVTEKLIDLVEDDSLDWKPASGDNWMTTGQLLMHIATACGAPMKGFITGDWGMPADFDPSQMKPEDMLPPAEKLPAVGRVAEARNMLAGDKKLALAMLEQCSEEELTTKPAPAPWDNCDMPLGRRLLEMIHHLGSHKDQLFYYLKLQGHPVKTHHKWGM